jgi:hypothetical protein
MAKRKARSRVRNLKSAKADLNAWWQTAARKVRQAPRTRDRKNDHSGNSRVNTRRLTRLWIRNALVEVTAYTAAKSPARIRGAIMAKLTDKEIADLRKIFETCDLNGDGFITLEEFHSLLKTLDGDVSREECLLDFEAADTEGDEHRIQGVHRLVDELVFFV